MKYSLGHRPLVPSEDTSHATRQNNDVVQRTRIASRHRSPARDSGLLVQRTLRKQQGNAKGTDLYVFDDSRCSMLFKMKAILCSVFLLSFFVAGTRSLPCHHHLSLTADSAERGQHSFLEARLPGSPFRRRKQVESPESPQGAAAELSSMVQEARPGKDSYPIGIVVNLSELPEDLVKPATNKHVMLALPRAATGDDVRLLLAPLLTKLTKVQLFRGDHRVKGKHSLRDRQTFPQVEADIEPVRLLGEIKTDRAISRETAYKLVTESCSSEPAEAKIRDAFSILVRDIPSELIKNQPFDAQIPHYWSKGSSSTTSHLLLFLDRSWCGNSVKHLLRYHTIILGSGVNIGGVPLGSNTLFSDVEKFKTTLLTAKLKQGKLEAEGPGGRSDTSSLSSRSTASSLSVSSAPDLEERQRAEARQRAKKLRRAVSLRSKRGK
ncbi:rhoptry protein rop15 [Cystoisospora suis]|uniref:Rhoptry protein rop15 n=1 Tax=Cystoisospora suis TaxID=483139 RepID=A0A2C6LDD5_9APIC|nr:rhoptry protein rop15 [Cystoisospora suis]